MSHAGTLWCHEQGHLGHKPHGRSRWAVEMARQHQCRESEIILWLPLIKFWGGNLNCKF